MELGKNETIESAKISDVDEIINLYRSVYGKKYPISYGKDPELLKRAISNKDTHLVLVGRDLEQGSVSGVLITEIDSENKIGKLVGLVVHPKFQKNKIGINLVAYASKHFLEDRNDINSLYATTRTNTVGPQRIFIKMGYHPLGIFPNAHRLTQYETVALFAKFKEGILDRREVDFKTSATLLPIYNVVNSNIMNLKVPEIIDESKMTSDSGDAWEYEIIKAPNYVYRKFLETFPESKERFFPFHSPNMIISDKKGSIDIFAYFSKRDGYCTLIKGTKDISEISGGLTSFYMALDDIGVSYIEVLVPCHKTDAIETLFSAQFVPSALYPAMREVDGKLIDYIVMSRTMEPLNFRGMAVISHFKPYVDLYVDTWKQVNLESIEVIYGGK